MHRHLRSSTLSMSPKASFSLCCLPYRRLSESSAEAGYLFFLVLQMQLCMCARVQAPFKCFYPSHFFLLIYILLALSSCLTSYLNWLTWKGWILSAPHLFALCWPKSGGQMSDLKWGIPIPCTVWGWYKSQYLLVTISHFH